MCIPSATVVCRSPRGYAAVDRGPVSEQYRFKVDIYILKQLGLDEILSLNFLFVCNRSRLSCSLSHCDMDRKVSAVRVLQERLRWCRKMLGIVLNFGSDWHFAIHLWWGGGNTSRNPKALILLDAFLQTETQAEPQHADCLSYSCHHTYGGYITGIA